MKRTWYFLLFILLTLGGCLNPARVSSGGASLCLLPRIQGGIHAQELAPAYSKASINHLTLKLFTLADTTETPVMNGETQLARDLLNAQLDNPVTFSNLKTNTTYRIRAYAYKAPGTDNADLISNASSYVDITVATDDRPTLGSIPVLLTDRDFNGQATGSMVVNPGGYYAPASEFMSIPYYLINSVVGNHVRHTYLAEENLPATKVSLSSIWGVAAADGKLYLADNTAYRVHQIDLTTGFITTVAGNGTSAYSGDGGQATNASLKSPYAVAAANNKLYIADKTDNRIRMVDLSTGLISTVAGNGTSGYNAAHDGGQATSATVNGPQGLTVDNGNLYIADSGNDRVRKVDLSTGIITTVAGNGTYAYGGDAGPATSASMKTPTGVSVYNNKLYIADRNNNRIRMVDFSSGNISTVAGTGTNGFSGDSGQATSANLNYPQGVTVDSNIMYITDQGSRRIRKVVLGTGIITTIAGTANYAYVPSQDGGPGTSANLYDPAGSVVVDGKLYIADTTNRRIRKLDLTSGIITTFAGNGSPAYLGDGGQATNACLWTPKGVAVADGKLYIAENGAHCIRKVDLSTRVITTIAGIGGSSGTTGDNGQATAAKLNSPCGILVADGKLYIADTNNNRIRKVDFSTGIITTVAGSGAIGYNAAHDGGQATSASLNYPLGVALANNKLYIADTTNHRIRMVDLDTGIITTVAGNGTAAYNAAHDGGQATSASLNYPNRIAEANNKLYIADTNNQRIRMVDLDTGIITTIAGNGTAAYDAAHEGGQATNASLKPADVMVHNEQLFIVDAYNNRIRKIDLTTGIITTVAGNGTAGYHPSHDRGRATSATLNSPSAMAVDSLGVLYISEALNHRIRTLY